MDWLKMYMLNWSSGLSNLGSVDGSDLFVGTAESVSIDQPGTKSFIVCRTFFFFELNEC